MAEPVSYELSGSVARITMDDGKANVMSTSMLGALHDAFDRAERDRAVVVLTGRSGIFSAGFDLNIFRGGDAEAQFTMLKAGAELALRLLSHPTPVVAACTGHAYPMGAFLLLAADARVGVNGPFQIGLNEVAIGLRLPQFAVELARQRLAPSYFSGLTTGRLLGPEEAVRAGYLDTVVPREALSELAEATAKALSTIDFAAHAATKARIRRDAIQAMRAAIDGEITLEASHAAVARRAKV